MKKILLVFVLFLFTIVELQAQTKSKASPVNAKSVKVESQQYAIKGYASSQNGNYPVTYSVGTDGVQVKHDKAYYLKRIEHLNILIDAIDEKVAYVQSHPEQKKIATKNGWFKQMEKNKTDAITKKKLYEKKLKSDL